MNTRHHIMSVNFVPASTVADSKLAEFSALVDRIVDDGWVVVSWLQSSGTHQSESLVVTITAVLRKEE